MLSSRCPGCENEFDRTLDFRVQIIRLLTARINIDCYVSSSIARQLKAVWRKLPDKHAEPHDHAVQRTPPTEKDGPMNETSTETLTAVVEREVPFPAEKIWRALAQPHLIEEWLMKNGFKPGHRTLSRR